MGLLDILVFVVFVAAVIFIGLWKSRGEELKSDHAASDYFLAGRGLTWWLVGFSLIAANISTEQFVGMSGQAADAIGMAIASYEWMAAITLVVVAFLFVPTFLRSGIYTIPEFLEYRYNSIARTVMAVVTLVILVGVPTASVIYSGAKVITVNFPIGLAGGCYIIGIVAALYVFAGGLKACAWADLIQGSALILGGVIIAYLAMKMLGSAAPDALVATATTPIDPSQLEGAGAVERLKLLNQGDWSVGKLHMVKPASNPVIPWTALVVGLWIPNFFYWGLNQYICQRTLGAKSLAEGQRGVVFAAALKLVIPFVVVIPGLLAFNLFMGDLNDQAVTRNAKTISIYAPELYLELSDASKPDPTDELNKNAINFIESKLEDAGEGERSRVPLFNISETIAQNNTADAIKIVMHNASMVDETLPADFTQRASTDMAYLLAQNSALIERGESREFKEQLKEQDKKLKTETLVLRDYDSAFPVLIKRLLPEGWGIKGFVLAAIFGAVISSLASMLNSSSTIFTMDIYKKLLNKNASQDQLVKIGRVCVVSFVVIAMVIAPSLDNPGFGGIFTFIQEFQGFISPGILAIFLFGVIAHRAPRTCGTVGLILNPILYAIFKWSPLIPGLKHIEFLTWISQRAFLDRMAICFFIILAALAVMTALMPMAKPVVLPVNAQMNMETKKDVKIFGAVVVVATLALYAIFW